MFDGMQETKTREAFFEVLLKDLIFTINKLEQMNKFSDVKSFQQRQNEIVQMIHLIAHNQGSKSLDFIGYKGIKEAGKLIEYITNSNVNRISGKEVYVLGLNIDHVLSNLKDSRRMIVRILEKN